MKIIDWKKNFKYPIILDSILATTGNVLGKSLGFLIPLFIAAWFGVGVQTDVFFFVYGLILYLTEIFSSSLASNIVPFIADIRAKNEEGVSVFVSRLISVGLIALPAFVGAFLLILSPFLELVTNFSGNANLLLIQLLVATSPLFVLLVLSSILGGILNAYFRFGLPAVSPGIRAIICIGVIFVLKNRLGIYSVVLGYIVGEIVRLLVFLYLLLKGRIISLRFDLKIDTELMHFVKVFSFQALSMIAIGLNPVVDKIMASWLGPGNVSILQYADRLYYIPVIFVSSGLIVVILSRWSDRHYRIEGGNINALKKDMKMAMMVVAGLAIFLTIVLYVFSRGIVSLAYGRGDFPLGLLGIVRKTFLFYLVGVTFYLLSQVIVRAHLVVKNTKVLLKTAIISGIFNILLNFLLMPYMGIRGIALATSVTSLICFGYLWFTFYQKSKRKCVGVHG